MVLSNRERQRLYRQRMRAKAAEAAGLNATVIALLVQHRQMIEDLDNQIALMESGAIRFHRGAHDATAESLERTRQQRANLQKLVDEHDPDGTTKLDREADG